MFVFFSQLLKHCKFPNREMLSHIHFILYFLNNKIRLSCTSVPRSEGGVGWPGDAWFYRDVCVCDNFALLYFEFTWDLIKVCRGNFQPLFLSYSWKPDGLSDSYFLLTISIYDTEWRNSSTACRSRPFPPADLSLFKNESFHYFLWLSRSLEVSDWLKQVSAQFPKVY